jgi:uncharacterized coiled-coil DUF342 family protein
VSFEEMQQVLGTMLQIQQELQNSQLRQSEETVSLREEIKDLKNSSIALRSAIDRLADICTGHERRVSRMEGREIDWWGDYLTLTERVEALEAWHRKTKEN